MFIIKLSVQAKVDEFLKGGAILASKYKNAIGYENQSFNENVDRQIRQYFDSFEEF